MTKKVVKRDYEAPMNTDDNRYVENAAEDKAKNYASKFVVLGKDLVALLRVALPKTSSGS